MRLVIGKDLCVHVIESAVALPPSHPDYSPISLKGNAITDINRAIMRNCNEL
jgi:hypothetical protein